MASKTIFISVVFLVVCLAFHNEKEDGVALERFFEEMDDNHDGQVDEVEAKKYIGERIGGQEYDSPVELTEAFRHMVSNIDRDPVYRNTITYAEVQDHLINLQHASVKEWIQHGLGLPQYAEKFKQNVITAADFPLLIEEEGRILKEELQIVSRLHRNQIIRGMKRLILGLGEHPSAPQVKDCRLEKPMQSTVKWSKPTKVGVPQVHKYLIEQLDLDRTDEAFWKPVREVEAHVDRRQYSETIEHDIGRHLFRIVAWTAYGPGPYANFSECRPHRHLLGNFQSTAVQSAADYRLIVSPPSVTRSTSQSVLDSDGNKAGYWSLFVVAITVALRILTAKNIAFLRCCLLWKLEKIALWMRMPKMAERISNVKRRECPRCRARYATKQSAVQTADGIVHPSLLHAHAVSHKIEPVRHFPMDDAHMVQSKSSPALGDAKTEYSMKEWDANEALEDVNRLPIPDYPVALWDTSETSSVRSKPTSSSSGKRSSVDVQSGLIEGQCAYEGCQREWTGVLQFRNRWSRHFCSICMQTYCYEHTHISPHGSFGFCGQHSRCVCENCFPTLPPIVQAQLEATNRLDKSPSKRAELERGCTCSTKNNRPSVRALLGIKRYPRNIKNRTRERQKE